MHEVAVASDRKKRALCDARFQRAEWKLLAFCEVKHRLASWMRDVMLFVQEWWWIRRVIVFVAMQRPWLGMIKRIGGVFLVKLKTGARKMRGGD